MFDNDLTQLRETIAPAVSDYGEAVSVTIAFKSTNNDGEPYVLPSAAGRMTSATFTIPKYDEIAAITTQAVERVKALQDAGLFADVTDSAEFPGIDRSDITLSVDVSL